MDKFEKEEYIPVEAPRGRAEGKVYEPPQLVEWGRVLDLTFGPGSQFQDGFGKGGTKGV